MCFLMGSCWLFISFIKDTQNDLDQLSTTGKSGLGRLNVTERFCNLVKTYSNVKVLSITSCLIPFTISLTLENYSLCNIFSSFSLALNIFRCIGYFNAIYEFKILFTFLWALLSITSSLMILQEQLVECISIFSFRKKKSDRNLKFIQFLLFEGIK